MSDHIGQTSRENRPHRRSTIRPHRSSTIRPHRHSAIRPHKRSAIRPHRRSIPLASRGSNTNCRTEQLDVELLTSIITPFFTLLFNTAPRDGTPHFKPCLTISIISPPRYSHL
ncbi:hypothetical protein VIGAN_02047500 [Vigna angularis var. angularis]|uniref:Uncharacterized protein n=1 Tax=Vigna angularis var. angularis TaxID=157739 RepID=A0A0S3RBW0_PHAAN|nr:hypothetical protein VIGAN_02047500 [Vigna angularis var. angularis]